MPEARRAEAEVLAKSGGVRRGRGAAHAGGGLSEAERERRVAEMMSDAATNEQMRARGTRGQKSTKEQLLDEEAEVRAKRDEAAARDGAAGRGGAGAVRRAPFDFLEDMSREVYSATWASRTACSASATSSSAAKAGDFMRH